MQQIIDQKSELEKANRRIYSLQMQLFTPERFKEDDASIRFYTGFPNWSTFMAVLITWIQAWRVNIKYSVSQSSSDLSTDFYEADRVVGRKKGRSRTLRPVDEFSAVMCRLRQGFAEEHLAHLFQIFVSMVSRIFISWINFMYLRLGQLNIWPSREAIDKSMPED